MTELFSEEDVRRYAAALHVAEDGEQCDCPDSDRKVYPMLSRAILSALAEDGRLRVDDELSRAYWKLREHASAYRSTNGFRRACEAYEADRGNKANHARYALHEWFARGIEAAARDIAELMEVPEPEIDPPTESGGMLPSDTPARKEVETVDDYSDHSGWDMALSRFRSADATRVHVGVQMSDGTYVSGQLVCFNPSDVESADRDLVLTNPKLKILDGSEHEVGCSLTVISARNIVRLDVTHLAAVGGQVTATPVIQGERGTDCVVPVDV